MCAADRFDGAASRRPPAGRRSRRRGPRRHARPRHLDEAVGDDRPRDERPARPAAGGRSRGPATARCRRRSDPRMALQGPGHAGRVVGEDVDQAEVADDRDARRKLGPTGQDDARSQSRPVTKSTHRHRCRGPRRCRCRPPPAASPTPTRWTNVARSVSRTRTPASRPGGGWTACRPSLAISTAGRRAGPSATG